MNAPLVSVVIPVRNYERYIAASIESVLAQRFKDWELIVVNDASTDSTGEIAERYAEGERVRVIHNERNLGQFPTHNRGAELTRGKYLKFFHGDDIMYPHCLEMMVTLMEAFPDAGLGISYNPWPWVAPHLFSPLEAWRAHVAGQTGMFSEGPSGTIFRADAFRRAGRFDGRFRSGDCEMNLRMAMLFDVLLLPGGLWWYRSHDKQVLKQMTPDNTLPELFIWYRELLSHPVHPLSKDQKAQAERRLIRDICQLILNRLRRGKIRAAWSIWKSCGLSLRNMGTALSKRRAFPPIPVEARANWPVFPSKPSAVPSPISHFPSPHASPLVSVLIPVFNAEAHLAEAIESVLAQRFADWELIIVDDASTDRTGKIARSYADGNRIRYFRSEHNLGKWFNHNRCAELARGKYLKFLHADDLLYPHCLRIMSWMMEKLPQTVLGISGSEYPFQVGMSLIPQVAWESDLSCIPRFLESPTALIVHASVFQRAGGFNPAREPSGRELQLRLSTLGGVLLLPLGLHAYGKPCTLFYYEHVFPEWKAAGCSWLLDLIDADICPIPTANKMEVKMHLRGWLIMRIQHLFRHGQWREAWRLLSTHNIAVGDLFRQRFIRGRYSVEFDIAMSEAGCLRSDMWPPSVVGIC
ncbi:MAG: glycosyltransferase family A protein [Verrucomicrobiia bacterium]|jgi:glycosyltransferase involved in cell wall biosynthesis